MTEASRNAYQDKIRTIGVSLKKGTSVKKPVTDDRDGSVAAVLTEHWDDSQDANVLLKTVGAKSTVQGA